MSDPHKPEIVILDAYVANPGEYSWAPLEELGHCTIWERSESTSDVLERTAQADIVLTDKVELSREILEQLPNLKLISVLATGYNVVDIKTATERGILLCNVPNYSTASVTQHVFAVLLQLLNHTGQYAQAVADGAWCGAKDFTFFLDPIRELEGLTLGIIGYGEIGRSVASIAKAFGMKVLVHSRTIKSDTDVRFTELTTVLAESDVISLHCPQTPDTTRMINAQTLSQMKTGAYLLNTARGGLLDEAAVAEALNSGRLAGAALDVLSVEPPPADNPLLAAKNCLITPHVAWAGLKSRRRLLDITFANIRGFLQGKPLNLVNPDCLKNQRS
ncbi:MAG: D-2-hydroxyacid dehydrogenase [Lentisphaeria bacterium]